MIAQTATEVVNTAAVFFAEGIGATIVLLMPGYLLGVAYSRGIRGPAPSERAFVANAAAGAVVVHLLMLFWTVPLATRVLRHGPARYVPEIAAWTLVVLIVVPTLVGAGLALLAEVRSPRWLHLALSRIGLSATTRTAEAWNWWFGRHRAAWVRVRLRDGRTVFGLYERGSFASSDANLRDLYLQEHWESEQGWFKQPYPRTRGIWLNGNEIISIEFFGGRPKQPRQAADQQQQGERRHG